MKGRDIPARFTVIVLALLVMASWFIQMMFPIESFDFFYHLATGRWIAEHRSIPTHDVFSSTARGTRWITHEWAAQVGLYLSYRLIGINGLLIAKSIWLALSAGLLFLLGRRLATPVSWTALLTGLAAPALAFRAFLRPHVLSWGFLVILLFVLYTGLPRRYLHKIIAISALFLVWANCHSGFVFGLFVLGVFQFWELLKPSQDARLQGMSHRLLTAMTPVVSAAVAALISPNTWHAYRYPFLFIAHKELFGLVAELRPLTTPEFQGGWFIPITYGIFLIAAAVCLFRLRHGALRELVLIAVFSYMAISSVRNVPNAVLIAISGLMLHGGSLLNQVKQRLKPMWKKVGTGAAVALATGVPVFLGWMALTDGIPIDRTYQRNFGNGVKELNYPSGAIRYLQANPIKGNYFNTFAFGGFILWEMYPDPKIFIDGRLFVYIGKVMDAYIGVFDGTVSLDELSAEYGVTHLVLAFPDDADPSQKGLYATLAKERTWVLVYWDDSVMVYVRDDLENAALVQRDGYRAIHPLERTLPLIDAMIQADPDLAFAEAERGYRDYPVNTGAAVILGRICALRKEFSQAVDYYGKVLDRHPENDVIRAQRALGLMGMGRFSEAESDWNLLLSKGRPEGFMLMNRGICLHRLKQREEAMVLYRQAAGIGYQSAELMNSMGIYYAEGGNIREAVKYWEKGLKIDSTHAQLRSNLDRARKMAGL